MAVAYKVEFKRSAVKALARLPRKAQRQIGEGIDALSENPFPPGAKKLEARSSLYRIRVGDYRVIYTVRRRQLLVLVLVIGHRGDVCRRLTRGLR